MFRGRPAGNAPAVDSDARPVTGTRRQRGPNGGTVAMFGPGRAGSLLARVVRLLVSIVVLIIVAGILLVVLKANPANGVVSAVHSWAQWLVGPFGGMFSFRRTHVALAVNWGIAAAVYLLVGALIIRLIGGAHRHRALSTSYSHQEGL